MSKKLSQLFILSLFVGLASGFLSSYFLKALAAVTHLRENHSLLLWGLPIFGLLLGLVIKKIPHHINQGVPYILQELDNKEAIVSPWMAPFVFISSLGTHLFGGSAGREGVGVIMGASVSHLLPGLSPYYQKHRAHLIYAGMAAGFSSIFGTPLAAVVFTLELHRFKEVKNWELIFCSILSSLTAVLVPHLLKVDHQFFDVQFDIHGHLIWYILVSAIASGIGANIFYWGLKFYTKFISKAFRRLELKLFFGGLFVTLIVTLLHGHDYIGIGTEMIGRSFSMPMDLYDFFMKCLLTIMTISVGFKGGEVTPLFFMGATLSNRGLQLFNLNNYALSSSLGMMGLFGAVTHTPLASAIMGCELFGWKVGILCFGTCFLAKLFMMKRSVYRM